MNAIDNHFKSMINKGNEDIACEVCDNYINESSYQYDIDFDDIYCSNECLVTALQYRQPPAYEML